MATSTYRLRVGALAAAAAIALTGLAAASPAAAGETPAPVIQLDRTEFPAGDWGTGFHVTGTGFDAALGAVTISVGAAYGPSSGEGLYETTVAPTADGSIDVQVLPVRDAAAPDESGYPRTAVSAHQVVSPTQNLRSNSVPLTITPSSAAPPAVTIAQVVSPEQLAAGLTVNFSGFGAGEPIYYSVGVLRAGAPITEPGGSQEAAADASGAGSFVATVPGAQVGDVLEYFVTGGNTGRNVNAQVPVVAAPPAPAAPAATPDGPALAETGVEPTVIGIAALALVALGALTVVVRRRAVVAGR
ncbi:hypothetical protein GE115_08170 [Agromyces sp. CFH 90414]|uniref:LPXTG cell wall anchor domain-containing protein n=1 Tax=Agromyces agglutinans TaxID=2662258 RepID=A0A6I2F5C8_9MICO|nr:hypothetical protein [Agromyces agglutinans]MRG59842.1 hypothetical protein [Agromyces agglutinans]